MFIFIRLSQVVLSLFILFVYGWKEFLVVLLAMLLGGLAVVEEQINGSPRRR